MRRAKAALGWLLLWLALPAALALAQQAPLQPAAGAVAAEDTQWTQPAHDPANTRFSPLDQINAGNAARLARVFRFDTETRRGQESAVLAVNDTLYLVTPFPNTLFALDLQGNLRWRFDPEPLPAAQGVACCDTVARGPAYEEGRVFINTLDGQTIAVDAASGRELWRTKLGDIQIGETITMAPLVARGRVLVGNSGGEYGVRGWIAALDAASGRVLWRAYSTGPDSEVLIGPRFAPHYPQYRGRDLGVSTWPPEAWRHGGGTVWGWVSYDPALNLVFHGTANPGPWQHEARPGDNLWTAGVFARDLETGEARWFYQWSPHDVWDHDGINENILLDGVWQGRERRLLLHPERNGYIYVLDRESGEVLAADPYHHITTSRGVDLASGRLRHVPAMEPRLGRVMRNACPTASGAKDWNPSAYSPRTGLLYIPHVNLCMDFQGVAPNYIAGTPYVGAEVRMIPGPGGMRGRFTAWNVLERRIAWQIEEDLPVWSGALVTAGDVVFYGTMDGWFKALDARSGRLLWQEKLESGIIGQPTTFRVSDGRQYVAIMAGVGGWAGAIVSGQLDPRDATAALGFVNAMRDLPQRTRPGGSLHVFALPQ